MDRSRLLPYQTIALDASGISMAAITLEVVAAARFTSRATQIVALRVQLERKEVEEVEEVAIIIIITTTTASSQNSRLCVVRGLESHFIS